MSEEGGYTIRPAAVSDAAVIAGHRVAMFRDMGQVPTEELGAQLLIASTSAIAALLREGSYVGYLAVADDQHVIGGAGVHVRSQLPRISSDATYVATRPVPLMVNVYTEPRWRRRGVARQLVVMLMRWAAEQGVDQMVLHASDAGRALYASLGFAATNEMRWSPSRARP
ncbi:MAG TPA: GNAT family N-acetyltransferase [Steroidobacteraceae bacterium]